MKQIHGIVSCASGGANVPTKRPGGAFVDRQQCPTWVKLGKAQREQMFSALTLKADSERTSLLVWFVPIPEVVNQSCKGPAGQLACPSRVSISSRSKVKSMGLVSNPVAPPSIAFRFVSGSP
jgi:hypothetical protein